MKKIYGWLKIYFIEETTPFLLLLTASFLGFCIWINYHFDFESFYIESLNKSLLKIPAYMAFYLMPWVGILFIQSSLKKDYSAFRNPKIWIAVFTGVFALSIANWVWFHTTLASYLFDGQAAVFARKIGWNLKNSIFYSIPLIAFKILIDKEEKGFYGLTIKKFDPRPYLLMLGIMLPFIMAASFTNDFQYSYPTYKPNQNIHLWGMPSWLEIGIYEIFYGADFTIVELFFRGFLVIGFAKWMGKDAILPMVGMYCFLHFGKPVGETISSCFGGLVLGVVAYETRSILGGVMVHMGIAWMMDIAAFSHLK